MKQILILLLCLILLIPSITAISLSLATENQIIFAPGKNVTIPYSTGNPSSQKITVLVKTSVGGELADYVTAPVESIRIQPFGTANFAVNINFPDKLPYGLYKLSVSASQKNEEGGMSGTTGAIDSITIINPYPDGHPYVELSAQTSQKADGDVNYRVFVKNIGKEPLKNVEQISSIYLNDQFVNSTKKRLATLNSLSETAFNEKIGIGNLSGEYKLQTRTIDETRDAIITVGQPKLEAIKLPAKIKANSNNTINLTFNISNWATPIENATVGLSIMTLLSSGQQATLNPGENTLTIQTTTKQGKSGTYPGSVRINGKNVRISGNFNIEVEGSAVTGKSTFRKLLGGTEEQGPEEQYATPEAAAEKSRNEIFLILILIASFVIFAFALGNYFAKKPREPQNEITQPTPPKTRQ